MRTGADEWRTVLQPTARFWTAVWLLYRQESHVETNLSPDPPALLGWEFEVVENFPGFALFFIVVLSGAVSTGCAMLHQLLREKTMLLDVSKHQGCSMPGNRLGNPAGEHDPGVLDR